MNSQENDVAVGTDPAAGRAHVSAGSSAGSSVGGSTAATAVRPDGLRADASTGAETEELAPSAVPLAVEPEALASAGRAPPRPAGISAGIDRSGRQRVCRAHSIAELRLAAQRRLPRPVFDFADGGAESEWTVRRNESAFRHHAFIPRPMNGPATRDLSLTLLGHRLSLPVLIGPTGLAGLFWPNGEFESARAAHEAGTGFCLSHGSVCSLEQLADAARQWPVADGAARPPRWMQVFVYNDLPFTWELTERAAAAGYDGLVLTIDNQLLGNRERDVRNGFTIPPRFDARFAWSMATRLPWLWQMRHALKGLTFGNYVRPGANETVATLAGRMAGLLDPGLNWDHVRELRRRWSKPLILKGVLAPEEALQAARLGVDAIIVSNHGGRQLDGAISSIEALPAIVEVLSTEFPRMPILLDGGIRRGTDVVKALALGASAVLVGRPQLFGLAAAGRIGVARMLDILRIEIDRTMGLVGARELADLGPQVLVPVDPAGQRSPPSGPARPA